MASRANERKSRQPADVRAGHDGTESHLRIVTGLQLGPKGSSSKIKALQAATLMLAITVLAAMVVLVGPMVRDGVGNRPVVHPLGSTPPAASLPKPARSSPPTSATTSARSGKPGTPPQAVRIASSRPTVPRATLIPHRVLRTPPVAKSNRASTGGSVPTTVPTTTQPSRSSRTEVEGNRNGADTFANYQNASGPGPRLGFLQPVQVSCKVHAPTIDSASPGGYWYRIASAPWNDEYYAVANTFLNGDSVDGPYNHHLDEAVPDC
jgi:hypothetical protein